MLTAKTAFLERSKASINGRRVLKLYNRGISVPVTALLYVLQNDNHVAGFPAVRAGRLNHSLRRVEIGAVLNTQATTQQGDHSHQADQADQATSKLHSGGLIGIGLPYGVDVPCWAAPSMAL